VEQLGLELNNFLGNAVRCEAHPLAAVMKNPNKRSF
jgi:hypothetical protein